jgi:cytochrome c oxidase assembly protein subunit 15
VDERVSEVGYDAKELWMDPATLWFYVHRSFSILVTLLTCYIYWRNSKMGLGHRRLLNWILIFIGIEVLSGITMYYVDFPFGTQPIHLVLATLLFGAQFYVLLESMRTTKLVGVNRS